MVRVQGARYQEGRCGGGEHKNGRGGVPKPEGQRATSAKTLFLQNEFNAPALSGEDFGGRHVVCAGPHGISFGARVMTRAFPFSRTAMSSMRRPTPWPRPWPKLSP